MKRVSGGKKLLGALRKASRGGGVRGLRTGFFHGAKYQDGTPVTNVAAWLEFGTSNGIPERPFMRIANREMPGKMRAVIKAEIDPVTLIVEDRLARRLGLVGQMEIFKSITQLRTPPLKRRRRRGGTNPLVDTGLLRTSVTYKVDR